jgi:hypothetical protein
MAAAGSTSSANHELELLRQQLSLKDVVVAELRESKAAMVADKDAVILELRERVKQQ